MAITSRMNAPANFGGSVTSTPSGTVYIVDGVGGVNALTQDIQTLQALGFTLAVGVPSVANFRNLFDGGDFTTNPWQRGTTFTAIASTLTYTADRWFAVGGASSSISVSQTALSAAVLGFDYGLTFGRAAANTNTSQINLGQVLETNDSARLQGQPVTVSFWASPGANFSALNQLLGVNLVWGSGTNQSAASMIAGSWTTQGFVPLTANQAVGTGGQNGSASTQAIQQLGNGPSRYSFTGTVPASATQVGFWVDYIPVGTAGAQDNITFYGFQLEVGTQAGVFEHRDVQVELEIAQRYAFVMTEAASGVVQGAGMNTGASAQLIYVPLPTPMVKAPTVTCTGGSPAWKTNQAGTATATTLTPGTTHTVNAISVTGNAAGTAGNAVMLQGGGGNGVITASADF